MNQAEWDAFSRQLRQARSSYHLTLGGLIKALEMAPPDAFVRIDDEDESPCEPHSYRDYYSDLSFERGGLSIVAGVLAMCRIALGNTYQGWKGGDYVMDAGTPLWLAQEGCIGRAIVSAHLNNGKNSSWNKGTRLILVTKDVEGYES